MRGLNYIDLDNGDGVVVTRLDDGEGSSSVYIADKLKLEDGAVTKTDASSQKYLTGISCNSGRAGLNVIADRKSQDVYCRNTYSWDTYKTVTCYVDLKQGDNILTFTNSGNNKFIGQDTIYP